MVEQDGKKFALVQADLGGLPFALTQEVMSRIEDTGITAERLMISATHTHSSTGPIWPPLDNLGYGVLGGDAFDPRIFELTAEGIAEAIRTADERLEPAKLGVGSTALTDASRNREFDTFKRNPEAPADRGRGAGGLDRRQALGGARRLARRAAAGGLVELRHPPDLVRRREPALLGRQRRQRRARSPRRRSQRRPPPRARPSGPTARS